MSDGAGSTSGRLALAAGGILAVAILFFGSAFQHYLIGLVMIYAISALALDLVMGHAGQISIGNGALMAIGAYATALLAPWAPFPLPLLASAVIGAAVGLLVGLPALRLRGFYLALSTLALHFIVVFGADFYQEKSGEISGVRVPVPTLGPITFKYGPSYTILLFLMLLATWVMLRNLYRRAPGRAWLAIKESDLAASVIGVPVVRWKMSAFVASSALIAFSGSLLAYYLQQVSSETFSLEFAISFIVMIIIGGLGSMAGAVLGAALITLAPFGLKAVTEALPPSVPFAAWLADNVFFINNGLYGILVLLFLLYQPRGLAALLRRLATPSPTVPPPALPSSGPVARGLPQRALLEVQQLRVRYSTGACAVDGLDLAVPRGGIVALLGRNGAGKTSTLRAIGGFLPMEQVSVSGSVMLDGRDITAAPPLVTSRLGLTLCPERDKIFPSLTVAEHLRLAAREGRAPREIYAMFGALERRSASQAGLLSGGERQMLALAVAASLRPRLLLVDELSLGLAPVITRQLLAWLRALRDREGSTVLLVEQNAAAALEVADYLYLVDGGKVVAEGTPQAMSGHAELQSAYMGAHA